MLFFLNYLKTWRTGIKKSLEKKRPKLRLLSSKKAKESEECELTLEVVICAECGDWVPSMQQRKPAPLYHCRSCKNRNNFDVRPITLGKIIRKIRIEY